MTPFEVVITVFAETVFGGLIGLLGGIWATRRFRRRQVARELLDWHGRISRAAQHGTVDVLATMAAMLRRVEALAGTPAACVSPSRADRS